LKKNNDLGKKCILETVTDGTLQQILLNMIINYMAAEK